MEEEELINISEETLKSRINLIHSRLNNFYQILRSKLDNNIPDEELMNSEVFKNCLLLSEILDLSSNDEDNSGFNRMLYFMWENCKGNVVNLLAQFSINIHKNEDGGFKFEVIIHELEGEIDGQKKNIKTS